jgi:acyl-CoA reductase-like NAD-dependent aldehyde dehydrogenase
MLKFHALVIEHKQELAELIVKENGKNLTEALADGKNSRVAQCLFITT